MTCESIWIPKNHAKKCASLIAFLAWVFLGGNLIDAQNNPYFPQLKGEAWLDLVTGKIHIANDMAKPSGPVIWGRMEGKYFVPSRTVDFIETAKQPDPNYSPGWIDLQTGAIHPESSFQQPPPSLFLLGRIHSKGLFFVYPEELQKWAGRQSKVIPGTASVPAPGYPISKEVPLKSSSDKNEPESGSSPPVESRRDLSGPTIRSLDTGVAVVDFIPREITIDTGVVWQGETSSVDNVYTLTFAGAEPRTLQMELFLESGSNVYE